MAKISTTHRIGIVAALTLALCSIGLASPAQAAQAQCAGTLAQYDATIKQLMALARQQGIVMAFSDVFLMLAVLFVGFGALAVVMRRPAAAPGAAAGH